MYGRLLAAALALFAMGAAARAQAFPERAITLVVNFAPGGLTDVPARMIAPGMQVLLGQPVVVVNKAGASGVVGGSYVVHAAPDGYTLLVSGISEVQNMSSALRSRERLCSSRQSCKWSAARAGGRRQFAV
jgi:tripartite-type tricarboxylate transporter receptor subunit TctC